MDRIRRILQGFAAIPPFIAVMAGHPAMAAPCSGYSRVVTFADGSARLAKGTACLARDGQWRVTEEHLTPPAVYSAPPPRAVYAPAAYYPAYPVYYDPWLWVWPATFLSIGYSSGGYHHRHHHGHHHH